MSYKFWEQANRNLIGKTLSEIHFEQLIEYVSPSFEEPSFKKSDTQCYMLDCGDHQWRFEAQETVWGMLNIDNNSIESSDGDIPLLNDLLMDLQSVLNISDMNLAGFFEEVQQTLRSELRSLEAQQGITAYDIVQCDEITRQKYLNAHPKLIANKGRLGWGDHDLERYAPESGQPFELHFLAVDKSISVSGFKIDLDIQDLFASFVTELEWQSLLAKLPSNGLEQFDIILVHPWQLQRYLKSQFLQYFVENKLIDLGTTTVKWLAQQSIRTLTAEISSVDVDVKTALTILNTSCYRGIPGKYIAHGARISAWLADIAKQDVVLNELDLRVQQEIGGVYCPHPYQSKIDGPYRYQEMLGCIWRERAESLLGDHQRPLSMATLMQKDLSGVPCIEALIYLSNRTPHDWLKAMFAHVVVPIYHLMAKYGVGIVAHGQNVTLILENHFPVGCLIKDFHGDLRLIDQDYPELSTLDNDIQANLVRLPAHYLIHDLLTGHFVTVLRFVSPMLEEGGVSEPEFYRLLKSTLQEYQAQHPELNERFKALDLLTTHIDKICLNKVRFKIGLGDSSERPLPELADPIANPLLI
ncbi:MAG TPA: IucA/IucC family protein [Vibrio sp.]|uniref:IucA/IucC family protein n=1 Tax=Vibrio TaxID=662 RepID=UPI000ED2C5E4|nr:IucA/IucC family protein [Vibrio sp.]HCH01835.1 IucA/IucC family protein [Vibrio sp.]